MNPPHPPETSHDTRARLHRPRFAGSLPGSDRRLRLLGGGLPRSETRRALTTRTAAFPSAFARVRLATSLLRRSEEHTSELQSRENLVCRLLLEKKNTA